MIYKVNTKADLLTKLLLNVALLNIGLILI